MDIEQMNKEQMNKTVKAVKKLVTTKTKAGTKEALTLAYKALDKAAKTKVIEKNKASRLKSRLSKMIAEQKA